MKKLIRILLAVLLLAGPMSSIALGDGTDPPPTCDPFTNPHCLPPPPMFAPVR